MQNFTITVNKEGQEIIHWRRGYRSKRFDCARIRKIVLELARQ
jgi:hypothetical protein